MEGQASLDSILPDIPENADLRKKYIHRDSEIKKHMSPPGALKLSPLLEARRLQFGLTDGAFTKTAMLYDKVAIWQISEHQDETFIKGGIIVKSDWSDDRITRETPRGILVGAGLRALDILTSNGVALGHIVYFISSAPWRLELEVIAGARPRVLVMNAGDILSSEDLAQDLQKGQCAIETRGAPGTSPTHILVDTTTRAFWDPIQPWIPEDH